MVGKFSIPLSFYQGYGFISPLSTIKWKNIVKECLFGNKISKLKDLRKLIQYNLDFGPTGEPDCQISNNIFSQPESTSLLNGFSAV